MYQVPHRWCLRKTRSLECPGVHKPKPGRSTQNKEQVAGGVSPFMFHQSLQCKILLLLSYITCTEFQLVRNCMFWNKYFIVQNSVSPRWFLFRFVTFYSLPLFKWRKKPGQWRKRSLRIFQTAYVQKVRLIAQPGRSSRPSGQPGGQESWPAKSASLARGKGILPEERTVKNI